MEINKIKNKIEKAIIALASADKEGKPHNIVVMYAKVREGKIIVTDNYMRKTIENIKNNPNISLVFWEGKKGWRIDGKAEYYYSGKWLNFIKSLKENKKYPAKGAVIVNIEKIEGIG